MLRKLLSTLLIICCTLSLNAYAQEIHMVSTSVNDELIDTLAIDDMLTILSAGKLKALIAQPEIAEKLQLLEQNMDVAFRHAIAELRSQGTISEEQVLDMELAFKQKMVLAIYAALYTKAHAVIAEQGTHEQNIILAHQLTPEKLSELFN